jgi:selenocysteine lyase/cysteine desulfurase
MNLSLLSSTQNYLHINTTDNKYFTQLINREFGRLAAGGHTYLDYTGGGLYAATQLKAHHELLANHVLGNPHSTNPTSKLATDLSEGARRRVLEFFNASEDYYCIFTANASSALKIVGECFRWAEGSNYLLTADNHNSVHGIREYCRSRGGSFTYSPIHPEALTLDREALESSLQQPTNGQPRLFAMPAQSNVSGIKHDLNWICRAKELGWSTLLDAAAFAPTNKLDLQQVKPDFACMSFYKIFGYPTGLGCLLVRKEAFELLEKPWFAGGTVNLSAVAEPCHMLRENHERYENGTINYLDLPAITIGLDFIDSVVMERITARVSFLMDSLLSDIYKLHHKNGQPLVRCFGPKERNGCGGTLIFNLLRADGSRIPFEEVDARATEQMISIRSGCFCNPGIDELTNDISGAALKAYFAGPNEGNYYDMMQRLGKMRGATRVSVGIATSLEDLNTFVRFLSSYLDH